MICLYPLELIVTNSKHIWSAAYADDASGSVVEKDCSLASTAMDQFDCYKAKLTVLEKELENSLNNAINNINTDWGSEADNEIRGRMKSAQNFWLQYRNNQCLQGYYTRASVHPPSQDALVAACKVIKTRERLEEISHLSAYQY